MNKRHEEGFTLIEVLIALVILGFVIVGTQAVVTDRMVRDIGWQERRARAIHLAQDRIHAIQADPDYYSLTTRYGGTETAPGGSAGFERSTQLTRTPLAGGREYLTVTVTVSATGLQRPVARTLIVGSP